MRHGTCIAHKTLRRVSFMRQNWACSPPDGCISTHLHKGMCPRLRLHVCMRRTCMCAFEYTRLQGIRLQTYSTHVCMRTAHTMHSLTHPLTHSRTHPPIHLPTPTHSLTRARTHARTHAHMHATHACMHACMHAHVHAHSQGRGGARAPAPASEWLSRDTRSLMIVYSAMLMAMQNHLAPRICRHRRWLPAEKPRLIFALRQQQYKVLVELLLEGKTHIACPWL